MRYVIAGIACLFSATALAHPPIDSTMAPCPILDENYQPIPEITSKSERLDIAKKKLRESGLGDGEYHWVCDTKLVMSGTGVDPDPVDPPPIDCDEIPRDPSCPPIDPPPVDCDAEPRPASCPPIDPPPVDCDADPSHSDCPPTDPNEPAYCTVPNCPQAVTTYVPDYPDLDDYTLPQECAAIHTDSSPKVTLGANEPLESALDRLRAVSLAGGVIEVPWNTPILQCTSIRLTSKNRVDSLTIKGLVGPNGEQPKFYCRSDQENYQLGGTIPKDQVVPKWIDTVGGIKSLAIENIHVDGYKGALALGNSGRYVVRRSYFHHGPHSGISSTNTGGTNNDALDGIEDYNRFSLAFCGSEIMGYGQGNHTHNFYIHRGLGGGGEHPPFMALGAYDTWSKFVVVDSFVHSPGWASAVKSIANENIILNNKIYSKWKTDPNFTNTETLTRFASQMQIDIPSCSINTIRGNDLKNFKDSKGEGGSAIVGLRGRRTAMRGCDTPLMWYPYKPAGVPVPPIVDGPAHTDAWWANLNGQIMFPTIIENNTFSVEGEFSFRQTAVEMVGTYPIYEGPKKRTCLLPANSNWYERSRVYFSGNSYTGFDDLEHIYKTVTPSHGEVCENQPTPPGPGPSADLYQVGAGETYSFGS